MKSFSIKSIGTLLLLTGISCFSFAQNKGRISGVLKRGKTAEPIFSAIILVSDKKTNAVVKEAVTDTFGAFKIENLPEGLFLLKANCIGYKVFINDSIVIKTGNDDINFGEIKMEPSEKNPLEEVIVTSSKNADKIGISTKKFSVEQSLVSKGGSAVDLLQTIPSVTVDGNNNINLRGSTNVNVLVDGKPSLIGGGDITQLLQSIAASSIESIELITNPSAKYQAEGETGIINIILKKNKKLGFNGSASVTAGTRGNYNPSVNLSFENSKVNIYAGYDFQHSNVWSNGHQDIQYLNPTNAVIYSNETFPSVTVRNIHNIKAGLDYYISPKKFLRFSGGLNSNQLSKNEVLAINQLDANKLVLQTINNKNITNGSGITYNANVDFIKTFNKPKEELVLSIGYAHGKGNNDQYFNSYVYNTASISNAPDTSILHPVGDNHNSYYNIQADYSLPIGTGKLETGYRTEIRVDDRNQLVYSFNGVTKNYDENLPLTNFFRSTNQIHALYISYQNQINKTGYQIGLRGEDAILRGNVFGYDSAGVSAALPVKVINMRLYPSITITQKITGNGQLQFSYARRVRRPTPRSYSPIPDVSDPVNYDKGNPNILPEDIHAFEFGYSNSWNKMSLTSSVYYRITSDFIQHIETVPVNGIITTISENILHAYTEGMEVITGFHFVKAWNFTFNINLFENETDALPEYGIVKSNGFSWNTNLTNNFNITKNISLQIRGDYRAPNVVGQDRSRSNFGVDAGAKINVLHNKAFISLAGRDILNTRRWAFVRTGNGVLLDFERRTIAARASISFTYNFGKEIFKSKKIDHSSEHQEN
ncbi:TonB-dependent receptor domain-containing protein [Chitinophagaceae bacterium LWZ2-11]